MGFGFVVVGLVEGRFGVLGRIGFFGLGGGRVLCFEVGVVFARVFFICVGVDYWDVICGWRAFLVGVYREFGADWRFDVGVLSSFLF